MKKDTVGPQSSTTNETGPARAGLPAVTTIKRLGNRGVLQAVLQAKMTVGSPNTLYEQEADAIADQVMRMPDPTATAGIADSPPGMIQRACAGCEDELQREPLQISRVADDASAVPAVSDEIESSIRNLSGGQPLSPSTRAFMEPRFGADFSAVRVHTGTNANTLARAVSAAAFTVGNKVVFADGQTPDDRHLLAHELTHVRQQGAA